VSFLGPPIGLVYLRAECRCAEKRQCVCTNAHFENSRATRFMAVDRVLPSAVITPERGDYELLMAPFPAEGIQYVQYNWETLRNSAALTVIPVTCFDTQRPRPVTILIVRITPSAIIFDYGNVLSQSQPVADVEAMAAILDIPVSAFTNLYWRFRVDYDAARLEADAYWQTVARTVSRSVDARQISNLVEIDSRSWSHPAPGMPQWARQLRDAGFKTALLSNMPVTVRDYIVQGSWLPEFDSMTFSCDVRICKPALEIYRDCLDKLDVKPADVLFLDDKEANIRAAEALGLNAVLFTNVRNVKHDIGDRFHLPALPEYSTTRSNQSLDR
jgi:putative hydrolase of the HAD superfamily